MALRSRFQIIETCAGYGGLELGLSLVAPRVRAICYVEREAYAVENLVRKMETGLLVPAPIWADITTFRGEPWRGKVDCVTGGIPCQPFSTAGKREGIADERWLWPAFWRLVRGVESPMLFVENVPGFVSTGLHHVLADLAEAGWAAEWDCFSAAQLGYAHRRERLFIVAHADGIERPIIRGRQSETGWRREDVPDSDGAGHKRSKFTIPLPGIRNGTQAHATASKFHGLWVADPTEFQNEWEAPRVVSDPEVLAGRTGDGEEFGDGGEFENGSGPGIDDATQPRLGGSTHGPNPRVDRLRLCGNGVVPAVAGFAFAVLGSRLGIFH